MPKENLTPPNFLTEYNARNHANPAPKHLANDVIKSGLAKKISDVVIMDDGTVYSLCYLPDGNPSNIFLYCGTVQHEPRPEGI